MFLSEVWGEGYARGRRLSRLFVGLAFCDHPCTLVVESTRAHWLLRVPARGDADELRVADGRVWFEIDARSSLKSPLPFHPQRVFLGTKVEFSPVDRCLASCSGDRTVKLWSITDFSCLRTFQGHTASVLSVAFVSAGAQLVSGGADGLVKVWTVRSDECEATLDAHTDKVWALTTATAPRRRRNRAVVDEEREEEEEEEEVDGEENLEQAEAESGAEGPNSGLVVVSGGADSVINVWKDVTAREEVRFCFFLCS